MPVSVHLLDRTEAFVPLLDGYPTKFRAGSDFSYCNGGFVVLALHRRAGIRDAVPPAGGGARVRSRRPAVHGLTRAPTPCPVTPRSATSRSTGSGGPTSSTCRCAATATAGRSRPSTTCTTSGRRSWADASCPTRRCRTCCGLARSPTRAVPPTGSGCGSTPATAASSSSGRTRVCRSPPSTPRSEQVTWTVLANTAGGRGRCTVLWPITYDDSLPRLGWGDDRPPPPPPDDAGRRLLRRDRRRRRSRHSCARRATWPRPSWSAGRGTSRRPRPGRADRPPRRQRGPRDPGRGLVGCARRHARRQPVAALPAALVGARRSATGRPRVRRRPAPRRGRPRGRRGRRPARPRRAARAWSTTCCAASPAATSP